MNKSLFSTFATAAPADTVNAAGGIAYSLKPKAALAQLAATGTLSQTYYASAQEQLKTVLELARGCDPEFVGKVAVASREFGFMKDMPALLTAFLQSTPGPLFQKVFERTITDGKMLRNFFQVVRSGAVGKKTFSHRALKALKWWFKVRGPDAIFAQSSGSSPSMRDVLKLAHPKPVSPMHDGVFDYLLGKNKKVELWPRLVREYEEFKAGGAVPNLPFMFLYGQVKTKEQWKTLASQASWQTLRMNLNVFTKHGVFEDPELLCKAAQTLQDPEVIRKARAFPYQTMIALKSLDSEVPGKLRLALAQAMEAAAKNIPNYGRSVAICPDVSGSMSSAITGHRPGQTSAVRCVDVAALVAASIARSNPDATIVPFDTDVHFKTRNHRPAFKVESAISDNAESLASLGGGGTACSVALDWLLRLASPPKLVIFVSDNESWADFSRASSHSWYGPSVPALGARWVEYKRKVRDAKLVLIDLCPNTSTQAHDDRDVLNVGGFSDAVFDVIDLFLKGGDENHWVDFIEKSVIL